MKKTISNMAGKVFVFALISALTVVLMQSPHVNAASANTVEAERTDLEKDNITSDYFYQDPEAGAVTNGNTQGDANNSTVAPIIGTDKPGSEKWESINTEPIIQEIVPVPDKNIYSPEITLVVTGTTVTEAILWQAIQENKNIVIEKEYYRWTINSKDINPDDLKDIDLGVDLVDVPTIRPAIVSQISKGNPVRQITLNYHGMFGFTGTLTINTGSQYYGKHGNLFYCTDDGRVEFIHSVPVASNGNVDLRFEHASDYLLVMSDEPMSQADVPEELSASGSGSSGTSESYGNDASQDTAAVSENTGIAENNNNTADITNSQTTVQFSGNENQAQVKNVQTGDYDMVLPWIVCGVSALGILLYLFRQKKNIADR